MVIRLASMFAEYHLGLLGVFTKHDFYIEFPFNLKLLHDIDTSAKKSFLIVRPHLLIQITFSNHFLCNFFDFFQRHYTMDSFLQTTLFEVPS